MSEYARRKNEPLDNTLSESVNYGYDYGQLSLKHFTKQRGK